MVLSRAPVRIVNASRARFRVNVLASTLPLLNEYVWFKNGDLVPQTVDYLTSIGIIALAGDRESILSDYKKIRNMESKLVIR